MRRAPLPDSLINNIGIMWFSTLFNLPDLHTTTSVTVDHFLAWSTFFGVVDVFLAIVAFFAFCLRNQKRKKKLALAVKLIDRILAGVDRILAGVDRNLAGVDRILARALFRVNSANYEGRKIEHRSCFHVGLELFWSGDELPFITIQHHTL